MDGKHVFVADGQTKRVQKNKSNNNMKYHFGIIMSIVGRFKVFKRSELSLPKTVWIGREPWNMGEEAKDQENRSRMEAKFIGWNEEDNRTESIWLNWSWWTDESDGGEKEDVSSGGGGCEVGCQRMSRTNEKGRKRAKVSRSSHHFPPLMFEKRRANTNHASQLVRPRMIGRMDVREGEIERRNRNKRTEGRSRRKIEKERRIPE